MEAIVWLPISAMVVHFLWAIDPNRKAPTTPYTYNPIGSGIFASLFFFPRIAPVVSVATAPPKRKLVPQKGDIAS